MNNPDLKKVNKIVICGTPISGNKGGAALVYGAMKAFRAINPKIDFTLISMNYEADSAFKDQYGINIVKAKLWYMPLSLLLALVWYPFKKIGINFKFLLKSNSILKSYNESDLILNMTGIGFHDFFGKMVVVKHALWLLPAFLLKKPVIAYSQSLGPFDSQLNKILAKHCLNRVNALVIRGESSHQYIKELKIRRPILVSPDVGFLLDPSSSDQLRSIYENEHFDQHQSPLVGVSVNRVIDWKLKQDNPYITFLASALDYIQQKYKATIIFIPHDTRDKDVVKKIINKMTLKENCVLIKGDYPAEDLKGIIGQCDYFVGSRYHSIVASLSMCVPTLVIGWSHKYREIMKLFNQDRFIINMEDINPDDLINKIDELCLNKKMIKIELEKHVGEVRDAAKNSAVFVKNTLKDCVSL